MSLINDALKQAQKAKQTEAVNVPELRPITAAAAEHSSMRDFLLAGVIGGVLVMALVFLWFGYRSAVVVRARSAAEPVAVKTPAAPPAVVASVKIAAPVPVIVTNIAAVAAPVKPLLPTYKLQSIFFDPKNPEAMINGKTVFVGSDVSNAHVLQINPTSATILTATGERKVLQLPED